MNKYDNQAYILGYAVTKQMLEDDDTYKRMSKYLRDSFKEMHERNFYSLIHNFGIVPDFLEPFDSEYYDEDEEDFLV